MRAEGRGGEEGLDHPTPSELEAAATARRGRRGHTPLGGATGDGAAAGPTERRSLRTVYIYGMKNLQAFGSSADPFEGYILLVDWGEVTFRMASNSIT